MRLSWLLVFLLLCVLLTGGARRKRNRRNKGALHQRQGRQVGGQAGGQAGRQVVGRKGQQVVQELDLEIIFIKHFQRCREIVPSLRDSSETTTTGGRRTVPEDDLGLDLLDLIYQI